MGNCLDLVICDMDGVIFEGRNSWLDLHRALGTEHEALQLWDVYGQANYPYLGAITVEQLWRGRSAAPFLELVARRRYVDGVVDLFAWLRRHSVRTAIISSGPYQVAERAQRDLGVDRIFANRPVIADGRFAGTVEIMVDDNHKDKTAMLAMDEFSAASCATAVIGDSGSDACMASVVGLTIAYNPDSPKLADVADVVISPGALRSAIGILAAHAARSG